MISSLFSRKVSRVFFGMILWGGSLFAMPISAATSCTGTNSESETKTGTCVATGDCSTGTELSGDSCPTLTPVCCQSASSTGTDCEDREGFEEYEGVCVPKSSETGLSDATVEDIVINFMVWILSLFGFLAIIAFVVAGILYLTAAGDMNQIEQAKRMMKMSVLGIVVALGGLVIIKTIDALLKASSWV